MRSWSLCSIQRQWRTKSSSWRKRGGDCATFCSLHWNDCNFCFL